MTFFKMAAAAALLTLVPITAMAAEMPSTEQCDAWFVKADANKDGALGNSEGSLKYSDMVTKGSTGSSSDSQQEVILAKDMFLTECAKGTFGMPMN